MVRILDSTLRNSARGESVKSKDANLLAQQSVSLGAPTTPGIDATLTIQPRSRASVSGKNARVVQISPSTLTAIVSRIASLDESRRRLPPTTPALFISTSTGPTAWATVFTGCSSATSTANHRALPPRRMIWTVTCSKSCSLRAHSTMSAPFAAHSKAIRRPIPRLPPVTRTVFLTSFILLLIAKAPPYQPCSFSCHYSQRGIHQWICPYPLRCRHDSAC